MRSFEQMMARINGPLYVLGFVTPYGEIKARVVETVYESGTYTSEERLQGRPFRWSIQGQEYQPSLYCRDLAFFMEGEDRILADNWLIANGYVDNVEDLR